MINYENTLTKYFKENGEPIACTSCDYDVIVTDTITYDGGYPSEVKFNCKSCGLELGYYAYGSFDPAYRIKFEENRKNKHISTEELIEYYRENDINSISSTNSAEIYAILFYRQNDRRPLTNYEIDSLNYFIDYTNEKIK